MAVVQQSTSFPLFSSLPAELRLMVFEQALLPLIEPRIIEMYQCIDDPYYDFYIHPPWRHHLGFYACNRTFLRETESFVASAGTLSRVCRESRAMVQAFHKRHGQLKPQRGFISDGLTDLSLRIPLRPQGPHADLFLWPKLSLLEDLGMSPWSLSGRDLGHAKRWLVPIETLTRDLHEMEVIWDHHLHDWRDRPHNCSYIKNVFLMSPHDIIALVSADDLPFTNPSTLMLRYSDLVIVSADASRDMAIPGLENGVRDFILEKFEHCKKSLRLFESQRLREQEGQPDLLPPPARLFPDLYFACVDPLKRGRPRRIMNE